MYRKVIFMVIGVLLMTQFGMLPVSDGTVLAQNNDQIVYASGRDGAHQLYVMDADGTHAHALTSQGDNTEPSWSPDRQTIVFTSYSHIPSEIYLINADGSGERQVTSGGGYSASWSPDGQRLAFISERTGSTQLYVTDTNGNNVQQLTNDPNAQATAPAWSPDGQTIAFVYNQGGPSAIWLINANGSNLRRLTHDQTGEDYGTAWSPDGQHLAYVSTVGGDSDLLAVDANGANGEQIASLTSKYADDLTWSPDGTELAFTAWARRAPRAIFVVATDGSGDLRQLSQGSDDVGWPSWASIVSKVSPVPIQCPGVLPSRLVPGDTARVTVNGTPNSLRNGAGTDHGRIGRIPSGGVFKVLSGPECNTYAWYQVNYNGQVGWTAEGDNSDYWIEPYNSSSVSSGAPQANGCTEVAQQFLAVWPQLQGRLGCPGQLINTTQFAYQDFQRGKLIWRGLELDSNNVVPNTDGTSLVLYDDGSWQLLQFPKYNSGDPLYYCPELGSPRSALTPKRGFGKLLCEMPNVRERLGNPTSAEQGYPTSFVQEFSNGFLIHYHRGNNTWQTLAFFTGSDLKSGTWESF